MRTNPRFPGASLANFRSAGMMTVTGRSARSRSAPALVRRHFDALRNAALC